MNILPHLVSASCSLYSHCVFKPCLSFLVAKISVFCMPIIQHIGGYLLAIKMGRNLDSSDLTELRQNDRATFEGTNYMLMA